MDANNILTVVNRGPVPHVPSLLGRSAPEGLCRGRVSALLPLGDALCTTGRDSRSPQEGVLVLQSAALLIAERVAGQNSREHWRRDAEDDAKCDWRDRCERFLNHLI